MLRKQVTQKLLSKFRTHELTDVQVGWGDKIELAGFQYAVPSGICGQCFRSVALVATTFWNSQST